MTFVIGFVVAALSFLQQVEPIIQKDAISIHTVRKGNMKLRLILAGTITSVEPATAVVTASADVGALLKQGQSVDFEFQTRRTGGGSLPNASGKVTRLESNSANPVRVEIEFGSSLPESTTVGTRIGALIDTGEELRDIVLFDRPGDARPNTDSTIFVIEPGDTYAKRVNVRYGRQSGAQMEIISGLVPGDRVIVTDMSRWADYSRVRLSP